MCKLPPPDCYTGSATDGVLLRDKIANKENVNSGKRVPYFDVIKGVAIFMVLMQHVMSFCVRGMNDTFFVKFIGAIHMPLFFFISGWFTLKLSQGAKWAVPNFTKRVKQLLVPMIVVSTIWLYLAPNFCFPGANGAGWTFANLWLEDFKYGYWFTLVLFEIIAIYTITIPVFQRLKRLRAQILGIGVVYIFLLGLIHVMPMQCKQILSFSLVCSYYPIFMFGCICKLHKEEFMLKIENEWVKFIAYIVLIVTLLITIGEIHTPSTLTLINKPLLHISLAILALGIFKQWGQSACSADRKEGGRYAALWQYIGKNSLSVYLLHYFFLFPITFIHAPITSMNFAFVPMMVISGLIAAVITAVTLAIDYCFCRSKILSTLLLGKV